MEHNYCSTCYESKGDIQTVEIGAELNYWVIQWDYGKEVIKQILRLKLNILDSPFEFPKGQYRNFLHT